MLSVQCYTRRTYMACVVGCFPGLFAEGCRIALVWSWILHNHAVPQAGSKESEHDKDEDALRRIMYVQLADGVMPAHSRSWLDACGWYLTLHFMLVLALLVAVVPAKFSSHWTVGPP